MDIIQQLVKTAEGMEGFLPEEMQLISLKSANIQAGILNAVEKGPIGPTTSTKPGRHTWLRTKPNWMIV